MGLEWNGSKVKVRVGRASRLGIDKTMGDCVATSKAVHAWHNVTASTEGSIQILAGEGAEASTDEETVGRWGALAADALELELGTSRIGETVGEREQAANGNMSAIAGPQPEPGVTVEQDFTILPPGTMDGQDEFVTLHRPSHGTGPLMAPRPFLRPSADEHYPKLPANIRKALEALK